MSGDHITLGARLDISSATNLHMQLQEMLTRLDEQTAPDSQITIDANDVEIITSPALQILLAFLKCGKQSGLATTIINTPKPMLENVHELGLYSYFQPYLEA